MDERSGVVNRQPAATTPRFSVVLPTYNRAEIVLEAVNSAPLPANVPFTSIYTCTDEYIQPYETSIIPGAKNIGLCDEFVGHFQ